MFKSDNIRSFIQFLKYAGIPTVNAPGDAEAWASLYVSNGIAKAVISDDTDCLPFGAKLVIRGMSSSSADFDKLEQIDLEKCISLLNLDQSQFVDLCILLGTDYNSLSFQPENALALIRKYKSLENIHDALLTVSADQLDEAIFVRAIFARSTTRVELPEIINWFDYDIHNIKKFLKSLYMDKAKLQDIISSIEMIKPVCNSVDIF
ncbi:Flap endonuclease 1 [Thelohanellus kitauei]|uniref:Flap endonuclease 1 n=1 Tax=Thelohanellus kitauei TaxID=669202 RepID=A0A0C2MW84_THEKT|nr:Flap endonuclease 1 [Thelohanellus kitauei]